MWPVHAKFWMRFENRRIREEYLIVDGGKLAGTGAYSYTVKKERLMDEKRKTV